MNVNVCVTSQESLALDGIALAHQGFCWCAGAVEAGWEWNYGFPTEAQAEAFIESLTQQSLNCEAQIDRRRNSS